MKTDMSNGFRGVFPAMITPMTEREEVDFPKLEALVEYLIGAGVHGLIPLGSTGEFYALTPQERRDVLATVIRAAAGRVPVVPGISAGATREVVQYGREAEAHGAAGLLAAPPYYSLPREDELLEHYRALDRAVGIPIMLYNFPARTGVDMKPEFIERLAELKNIRYVKDSTGETSRISQIIRRCGDRMKFFCGCDTVVLETLVLGAAGWVAGIGNVCAAEHVQLYRLWESGEYMAARDLFYRLQPLFSLMDDGGKFTQMVKAGCRLAGRDGGPPRRPLLPPGAEEIETLRATLSLLKPRE
jgi:4-hydroxy-tetrahydrodipicolinate synthase